MGFRVYGLHCWSPPRSATALPIPGGAGRCSRRCDVAGEVLMLAQLERAGACSEMVEDFRRRFGTSVAVTEAAAEAVAGVYDWDWAASKLLPASARAEYKRVMASALAEYERVEASAWAEYKRAEAPALAEYKRVMAPAWAEYERVVAPAQAEYKRAEASALAEYKRAEAPAWAEYERVTARTFVRLYGGAP